MARGYVYILASARYGTLYVGVTNDLMRRVWEHREAVVKSFTQQHNVKRLVWYEVHESMLEAIAREKRIKRWHRDWKVNLIQSVHPDWSDLYDELGA